MLETTGDETAPPRPSGKTAYLWATLFFVVILVQCYEGWRIHKLGASLDDFQFDENIHRLDESANQITPTVGLIQFLRKGGYSITLNEVTYTSDGLHLEGNIGNPMLLRLTNLSLKFTATKPPYGSRAEFDKDEWRPWFGPPIIGEAQTSPIDFLGAGATAPFSVTIPNVKQTKEGFQIEVSFVGERYQY